MTYPGQFSSQNRNIGRTLMRLGSPRSLLRNHPEVTSPGAVLSVASGLALEASWGTLAWFFVAMVVVPSKWTVLNGKPTNMLILKANIPSSNVTCKLFKRPMLFNAYFWVHRANCEITRLYQTILCSRYVCANGYKCDMFTDGVSSSSFGNLNWWITYKGLWKGCATKWM